MGKKNIQKEEEEKMKKLITILAVMIVLVGAAFATDSAQITVNATVSERVPSFKLTTTGNTAVLDAEATAAAITTPAGTGSVTIKNAIADELADGTNQTVTFGVVLVPRQDQKKIKTTHTYTFTASASALAHTTPALAEDNKFAAAVGNFSVVQSQGNPVIPATVASITANASLVLTFNGKSYDPGNAEFVFATFPVTYTGNANAVPGAYQGTVTIELATT